ncbi:hypothetical protein [Rhodococcus sp. NPDC058521]|uniref:hypothetical protein n=1 Tax=Rhodococcus sp. NPDC058521 TaxID=3346536 RepID=UPI00364B2E1A
MTSVKQRSLTAMVAVMAALALFCACAMFVDDRTLLGVSVWLEPFKFAVSFAIFGATLAWMLRWPGYCSSKALGTPSWTRAIRVGLFFAVVGMMLGYTMGYHGERTEQDAEGRDVVLISGHTVGASDADPGLPLTNWSSTGGDMRIPHFIGLHGMQAMLLVVFVLEVLAARHAPRHHHETTDVTPVRVS